MGLDTSHGAWHGGYISFMRWREEIAKTVGINLKEMEGFDGPVKWESLSPNPLHELLNHSDCDGEISWESCGAIAIELGKIIDKLPDGEGGGHIGSWKQKTQTFIDGCKLAYSLKEPMDFH